MKNNNISEKRKSLDCLVKNRTWDELEPVILDIVSDEESNDIDGEVDWDEVRDMVGSVKNGVDLLNDEVVELVWSYVEGVPYKIYEQLHGVIVGPGSDEILQKIELMTRLI